MKVKQHHLCLFANHVTGLHNYLVILNFNEINFIRNPYTESTPVYISPLTYIVNKKIIKNPNEFSG